LQKKKRTDDVTYVQVICTLKSCSMECYLKVLRYENYIDTENISVRWVSRNIMSICLPKFSKPQMKKYFITVQNKNSKTLYSVWTVTMAFASIT